MLLVDADPQVSAAKWASLREEVTFPVIGLARPTLHKDLPSLAADYDHVVIDGPPRVAAVAKSILLAADVVLIPVQPSPTDVWATAETVDLLDEARVYRPDIRPLMIVTRRVARSAVGRDVRSSLAELRVPVLAADLGQRVAFVEALAAGRTVADVAPNS